MLDKDVDYTVYVLFESQFMYNQDTEDAVFQVNIFISIAKDLELDD